MLFFKNAFLCQLLHQLIANFPTVSCSVIKAYENNLLISFHFETNRQLNQRSNCENSVGLLFQGGILVQIMTVSLEIISLASLMVVTVISSFPFTSLLFLITPYSCCFPQKPKIYN